MKRIIFLFALLYGATLMAQNKAVAVTEVVDKEDKVSYATEIMVRTRLTAAISMKQGYTAYDRVDLQSIMSEQNFQRTGLVDDATIKRLGEMTGASLILIPEVAMADDGKIYVAVKMLDVTTAQTLMSTGELMGSSSAEVEEGCRALTAKVLDEKSGASNATVAADEPVTLFGYIHVFPTDIGEFQTLPAQLLSAINKTATYGYDSWRLPTTEELSIMRANSHLIPNFRNVDYLCSDSSVKGLARLVTTDLSIAEKKANKEIESQIRKKAILNLLDVYDDFENYIIAESIVATTRKVQVKMSPNGILNQIKHPNSNFNYSFNEAYIRKYACFKDGYSYLISNTRLYSDVVGDLDSEYGAVITTWYELTFLNKDYEMVKSEVMHKDHATYRSGRGFTNKYTYDPRNCLILYVASLPSEELIQKEMQKIRSTLEK